MNSRIIAFAGRKRSGKGMLAKGIQEYYPNSVIVTIADNLKYLCCELLNVSYNKLNKMKDDGTIFREKVDGRWISIIHKETEISDDVICTEIGEKTFTTVREMLQVIGTDLIRKYVPNWHIDKTIERIKSIDEDKIVIVDDVRFPNEKREIEKIGGEVFFIIRPNCFDVSNHPSETALCYREFSPKNIIINDLDKDLMVLSFVSFYFSEVDVDYRDVPILLIANPWYERHVMDITTISSEFDMNRKIIIKQTIEDNIDKLQFLKNGIITFKAQDQKKIDMFRRIIMNDRRSWDGSYSYSIYNPLTNEILKAYM